MKIHEFQAKEIIASYGVAVPKGIVVTDAETAAKAFRDLKGAKKVVKAQIHAGGRGKGGGVKVCSSESELKENAARILANPLITPQTGPEGQKVKTLLVEEGQAIKKELYFSILVDRESKKNIILASTEGGMEIEEVSEKHPEKIIREEIDPLLGIRNFQSLRIAYKLGLETYDPKLPRKMSAFINAVYKAFEEKDASLLEINPLVITEANEPLALDCKMTFDESALFRQPGIIKYRDEDEENPDEIEASKWNLNFIKLDGNIGCMVNGAGLAMATMDIIKYYGGEPANFLDVGGSATEERVEAAFRIITGDPSVKAIFINIFGGIVRCDLIAAGVISAYHKVNLNIPVVVRLRGNNAPEAKKLITESGLGSKLVMLDDIAAAAEKSVQLAKGVA